MCGIFGAIDLAGFFTAGDYRRFVCQTDLVAYRGPDDVDYRGYDVGVGNESSERFNVFLGHRRLSIIDLSPQGRQPLTDGRGRWIIFVGEIFNYIELRDELRRQGHQFRTATDTEVILKVYDQYGEDGFGQLNGMWAFILLDLPGKRVIASRDRFSIKGLHYVRDGSRIYLGSEIKQLLPFLSRRSVDRAVMHAYLTQALANHDERSFFEGVRAVKTKHSLVVEFSTGAVAERRYWQYQLQEEPEAGAVERFRDLFIDSVRIRLRSDVEVGTLLSGGLDSSAIAMVTDRVLGAGLKTYSVVMSDPRYSEERFVEEVTRTGIPNRRILFDPRAVLESLDDVTWHNDEPISGFSVIAHYRMLQSIKQETGIKVVLSGQGADETLLGYSKFFFFHLLDLLRRGRVVRAFRLFLASWLRGTTVRQFRLDEAQRYLPWQRFKPAQPYVLTRGALEPIHRGGNARERQMLDIDRYSVPVLARFEDRNSMAHSLEMRNPFLDHRLVDLALNLPVDLKLRDGWSKWVLRAAVPEMPPAVRWRRDKQGFITPEETWLREDLRARVLEGFSNGKSLLERLELIDAPRFLQYYRQYLAGDRAIWYADLSRVWLAEVWAQRFLLEGR